MATLARPETTEPDFVGTVEYISPEQARGQGVHGRSDLYSLGCVMYHLLAGRVPFPTGSSLSSLAIRIDGRPSPLSEIRGGLPAGLVELVDRLISPRPEDRIQTAAEVARALRGLALATRSAHPAVLRPGLAAEAA